MITRLALPTATLLAGFGLALTLPSLTVTVRQIAVAPSVSQPSVGKAGDRGGKPEGRDEHADEGRVAMTADQVAAAGIGVAAAGPGMLRDTTTLPGVLAANGDRLARVPARVSGTVVAVRRGLGEQVRAGDVLASVESRDLADAKGDLLTTARALALADAVHAREARLWRQRISAQSDLLVAAAAAEEARIKHETTRQRLSTLGLSEAEIALVPRQGVADRRILEIRSPIAGQVTTRGAVPGAVVAADADLFSVADLSTLWIEMTVPPRDLPLVRKGGTVHVTGEGGQRGEATVVFVNPVLDPETRSARVLAELPNPDGSWRAGGFVTANLSSGERQVSLLVPRDAVQEVERETVVFVRTPEGFEKRVVALGREGAGQVEVVFGLDAGEEVAAANAFVLKAELGKSEAGHDH